MVEDEIFNDLKKRIVQHFDDEMKLMDEFQLLKLKLTLEQYKDILDTMITHPAVKRTDDQKILNDLVRIMSMFR